MCGEYCVRMLVLNVHLSVDALSTQSVSVLELGVIENLCLQYRSGKVSLHQRRCQ